jgi:hypothetical protein
MNSRHHHRNASFAALLAAAAMLPAQSAPKEAAPSAEPAPPAAEKGETVQAEPSDQAMKAKAAVEAAVKAARESNRRVLVTIVSPNCPWCKRLAKVLGEDEVLKQTVATHYVPVEVEWKYRDCGAFGAESLKVPSVPYLLVLDAEGAIVSRQKTDPLELNGSYDVPKLNGYLLQSATPSGTAPAATPSTAP